MTIKVENLDKRICDCEPSASNAQTYREYIRSTEEEFELARRLVDKLTDQELTNYINFLDDLWNK